VLGVLLRLFSAFECLRDLYDLFYFFAPFLDQLMAGLALISADNTEHFIEHEALKTLMQWNLQVNHHVQATHWV